MRALAALLAAISLSAAPSALSTPLGDPPLDAGLAAKDETRTVVALDYAGLRARLPGELWIDTAFGLALVRKGTPYLWGGNDWKTGIDCSHFTWQLLATAGTAYAGMMPTAELRDLVDARGLRAIPLADVAPGDLLVYGYYDDAGWHGHVVVLVDPAFEAGGHRGLVVGSHGEVGVQFVTYEGFPEYWREPRVQLRNVLRVARPSVPRRTE